MQNLLFRIPKAAVLHGKSVGFASQNSRFRNAKTKLSFFLQNYLYKIKASLVSDTSNKKENYFSKNVLLQLYLRN